MSASLSNSACLTVRLRSISSRAFPKSSAVLFNNSRHSVYAESSSVGFANNGVFRSQLRPGLSSFSTTTTNRGAASLQSHFTDSIAIPLAVPKPWDDPKPELPVRVPFLPENDFARYHRREFVPQVAPPHKAVISTVSSSPTIMLEAADDSPTELEPLLYKGAAIITTPEPSFPDVSPSSKIAATAKEIFEELWPAPPPAESLKRNLFAEPNDQGQELTADKQTALKAFAIGSTVWWFSAEPAMVAFGIV